MRSSARLQRLLEDFHKSGEGAHELLVLHQPMLRLIAHQLIGNRLRRREDASDIVQRTILEAYSSLDQFRGRTELEFTAWLRQILHRNVSNLVRDHRAAKRDIRREQYVDALDEPFSVTWTQRASRGSTPSTHVIKSEAALNLARAIDELPEGQQTAVRLRHLQGCSIDEIADVMRRSPAAVAGLIRRGLEALRQRLKEDPSWL